MHWSDRYIGLPYREQDCAELAARVQREVFARAVCLPCERSAGLRGLTRQIEDLKGDYAERTEIPTEGDAVLMISRGALEHIGVYCEIEGEAWVLHAMRNAGQVVRHRIRALALQGLAIEGYYKWRTS